MSAAADNPPVEAARVPPRSRWFLRFAAAYVLLSAALVGLWFWWDAHSKAKLEAKIAALKAAGEPTTVEHFAVEKVPDPFNAEHFLELAAPLLIDSYNGSVPAIDYGFCSDVGLCRDLSNLLDDLIEMNREPLCLLRHARRLERSSQTPAGPSLSQYRQFARLAAAAANHAHIHLNDAEAIECIRDALALSRILAEGRPPTLINSLVGMATDGLACQTIAQIAAELDVAAGAPDPSDGPASREQIETLIAELLEDSAVARRFGDGIRAECAQNVAWLGLVPTGGMPLGPMPRGWSLIQPSIRAEARDIIDYLRAVSDATAAETFPEAKTRLPPLPFDSSNPPSGGIDLVRTVARRMMLFDVRTIFEACYEHRATRRMAAAALAIRLYELDNARRPTALADLVPRYLPEIPADPFAPQPQPIRYRPGEDACLYSVGVNGVDDGGVAQETRRGEIILKLDFEPDRKLLLEFPGLLQRTPDEP